MFLIDDAFFLTTLYYLLYINKSIFDVFVPITIVVNEGNNSVLVHRIKRQQMHHDDSYSSWDANNIQLQC